MASDATTSPSLIVFGGTGFIGQSVVQKALLQGWQVTSVSLQKKAHALDPRLLHVTFDLQSKTSFEKFLGSNRFDFVLNCSGYVNHSLVREGGRAIFDSQVRSLLNIIEFIDRDHLKSFVHIGSSDEYGRSPTPQKEDYREAPIAPYSLGKVACTHLLQMMHKTEGFPGATLRLFLTYGPGQNIHRFIPQVIKGCLTGVPFPVSKGEQLRDFCFIDDVADAIITSLQCPSARGEVINIGSGEPVAIGDLIREITRIIGYGKPQFGALPYRPGESMELFPDITKAKALLGWAPKTSLKQGLKKTIHSFLDDRDL